MNKYDVITGKRFFKYNPDTDVTNAFRVIKVLNENKIECKDESNDKVFTLNKKVLSEYNTLIPDALYCISLVSTSKAQNDIILYVMRKEDMEKSTPVPNIIGRQMILNDKNVDKIILGDYITNAIENKVNTSETILDENRTLLNRELRKNYRAQEGTQKLSGFFEGIKARETMVVSEHIMEYLLTSGASSYQVDSIINFYILPMLNISCDILIYCIKRFKKIFYFFIFFI